MPAARPLAERFHEKYQPVPFSGCWIWTGSLDSSGYGAICNSGGETRLAHRLSWIFKYGDLPKDVHVLHRCDVPCCVNPDHLFLGTHADNMQDCFDKRRHPQAKLSEDQVADIRTKRMMQQQFADFYGCSRSNISLIQSRKNWSR